MRKFQISSLLEDGRVNLSESIGPALPMFESAFSAFARGTLIDTTQGPVAVEDLVPGMKVITNERGAEPLIWIGSMSLVPNATGLGAEDCRLTRITADSFGIARPMSDLITGPSARILKYPGGYKNGPGSEPVLVPTRHMVDDFNVISVTPPRPVTVYHLCLSRHATLTAGGLDVETFHPGPHFEQSMGPNMLSLFMSFFSHIKEPKDFGSLIYPRDPLITSDGLEIA